MLAVEISPWVPWAPAAVLFFVLALLIFRAGPSAPAFMSLFVASLCVTNGALRDFASVPAIGIPVWDAVALGAAGVFVYRAS